MIIELNKKIIKSKDIEVGDIIRNKQTKKTFMIVKKENKTYCLLDLNTYIVTNAYFHLDALLEDYNMTIDFINRDNNIELIKKDQVKLCFV